MVRLQLSLSVRLFLACIVPLPLQAAVLSIGHRGNSLFAPENTVAAFEAAWGKADLVEFDVQESADGHLVVMHDSTVDRTTDGSGSVSSLTLAAIQSLDAGSWFATQFSGERVPTLAEAVMAIMPHATPLIERKTGAAAAYVAELRQLGMVTNVILQSFDFGFLTAVHALEPGIRLAALGSGTLTPQVLANIQNTGARWAAWEKSAITATELAMVRDAGLGLFVWTVDGAELVGFVELGVDAIISNDPGLVKALQQPGTDPIIDLRSGLVAYWRLDDGLTNPLATTAEDSKGANDGNLVVKDGATHWAGPPLSSFEGCVLVDGNNAAVQIPSTSALDLNTNAVTLSAWVKLTKLPSTVPEGFAGIFDSVQDSYVLYLDRSAQELRFKVTAANGHAARPGIRQALLRTNQWLHVAGTYSGNAGPYSGQATVYLNGEPCDVHTGNDSGGTLGLTETVKAGQVAAMGQNGTQTVYPFSGSVDDVAVWARALSPWEVRQLFERGQQGLSLGALLSEPSVKIQPTSVRLTNGTEGQILQIVFYSAGGWREYKLLRARQVMGPFLVVSGSEPVSLGEGYYRFDYSVPASEQGEFLRIEGR